MAGFGVPSDVFARFQRMRGRNVLMVSGTDEHGTPLLVQADKEGVTVRELADRYNRQIVTDLAVWDCPMTFHPHHPHHTGGPGFQGLYENGYMLKETTQELFAVDWPTC
ncbi:class I tRNA ligase family protein [Corynebacterium striatum]|uniref:class I tRNA ligase family protein n=1 Tax=Corynebacterium striatum TaxID=43770 RepID=UPI0038CFCFA3